MARTIEEISAEILAHKSESCGFEPCSSCTQLVPGTGDAAASLMLVGEAPGASEDRRGVPFVGAAGKLLDSLLDSVGLKREDVFITNVLKARPPDNRDPSPAEAEHHWPWLEEQIEAIDPDLIVLLGRHAMARFLAGRKISEVHGQPRLKEGRVLLPVYHPAAALYNGGLRETVFADFAQLPGLTAQIRALGRDELLARCGIIGRPTQVLRAGCGEDFAAEFGDRAEIEATAPSPASFADDYQDPQATRLAKPPTNLSSLG